jgi:hypothetical protein
VPDPTQLPPLDLQLDDFKLLDTNAVWVQLQFEDETQLSLEFAPDSPLTHDLLELIERAANELLGRLGQRSVKLSGLTAPTADDE